MQDQEYHPEGQDPKTERMDNVEIDESGNPPFIFTDGHRGVIYANGVLRLRLTRTELSGEGFSIKSVGQIAMPIESLERFYDSLGQILKDIKEAKSIDRNESVDYPKQTE